jgi:hypothetical protein
MFLFPFLANCPVFTSLPPPMSVLCSPAFIFTYTYSVFALILYSFGSPLHHIGLRWKQRCRSLVWLSCATSIIYCTGCFSASFESQLLWELGTMLMVVDLCWGPLVWADCLLAFAECYGSLLLSYPFTLCITAGPMFWDDSRTVPLCHD